MIQPDLDCGRRFIAANPPEGKILMCAVTGSHMYGFPSGDSDIDLKGIHLAPTEKLLGFNQPSDTFDKLEVFDGTECDYTSHEAGKALKLLLRGNGNILERLLSTYQLYEGDLLAEMAELARNSISKRFAPHYRGYFVGMQREHKQSEAPTAKKLLYSFRVALTGIHLLQTGELDADLNTLAFKYGFDDIPTLIKRKTDGDEKAILTPEEDGLYRRHWPLLEQQLIEALSSSSLPEEPQNMAECEAWLVGMRKKAL